MKKFIAISILLILLLTGCAGANENIIENISSPTATAKATKIPIPTPTPTPTSNTTPNPHTPIPTALTYDWYGWDLQDYFTYKFESQPYLIDDPKTAEDFSSTEEYTAYIKQLALDKYTAFKKTYVTQLYVHTSVNGFALNNDIMRHHPYNIDFIIDNKNIVDVILNELLKPEELREETQYEAKRITEFNNSTPLFESLPMNHVICAEIDGKLIEVFDLSEGGIPVTISNGYFPYYGRRTKKYEEFVKRLDDYIINMVDEATVDKENLPPIFEWE